MIINKVLKECVVSLDADINNIIRGETHMPA